MSRGDLSTDELKELNLSPLGEQLLDLTFRMQLLKNKKQSALERADGYDASNNTFLAGMALHDWHQLNDEYNKVWEEAKAIKDRVSDVEIALIIRAVRNHEAAKNDHW